MRAMRVCMMSQICWDSYFPETTNSFFKQLHENSTNSHISKIRKFNKHRKFQQTAIENSTENSTEKENSTETAIENSTNS